MDIIGCNCTHVLSTTDAILSLSCILYHDVKPFLLPCTGFSVSVALRIIPCILQRLLKMHRDIYMICKTKASKILIQLINKGPFVK